MNYWYWVLPFGGFLQADPRPRRRVGPALHSTSDAPGCDGADKSGSVAGTRLRRSGERGVLQPVGRRCRVRLRREVAVVIVRTSQELQ